MLNTIIQRNKNPWPLLLAVSSILLLLRLAYIHFGPLGLGPDEAQYWDWSRMLDWSYVTKPPLTTWIMAATTSILGDTLVGVRLFALLCQLALPVLGFLIVKEARHTQAAWWAFALLTCLPIIATGGYIMTPDAPSLVCWFSAIYLLVRLETRGQENWRTWLFVGLIIGIGGLAKPTIAFFYPCLGLYWLYCKTRGQTTKVILKGIIAAGLISLLCQAPVFYWNATHDWLMFQHVLDQADSDNRWQGLDSFLNFIGSQLLLVGPLLLPLILINIKRFPLNILWFFSIPIIVAFTCLSFFSKVQGNWPILGVSILIVLFACTAPQWSNSFKKALKAALGLNLILILLIHYTDVLRPVLPPKADPTKTLRGWKSAGQALEKAITDTKIATIFTTRYQTTAQLAFHTPSQPTVYYMNPGWRRAKHHDFMELPNPLPQKILYASLTNYVPEKIVQHFGSCQLYSTHANEWRTLYIFRCNKEG